MLFTSKLVAIGMALLPIVHAATHDVAVGKDGLTFTPEALSANIGDQVIFHFYPKNHSIVQSSFASPCGPKDGGFNSGFFPVAANFSVDALPTHTITVVDSAPVWIYCSQAAKTANSHCGAGMVFSVNCPNDPSPNSFTNFKKAALAIGTQLKADAANAPASSSAAPSSDYASGSSAPTQVWTAAYGGYTIAPVAPPVEKTVTVTVTETASAVNGAAPSVVTSSWVTVYSSYANSPAPTPVALAGVEHKVIVGGPGKLLFDPPHISAAPRDTVVFEFHQKNHTVTESTFADPCRRKNVDGALGFASGFQPVADGATQFPTWKLKVNTTSPVWAYCAQTQHCGSGMVFSINSDETSGRSFSAFAGLAQAMNGTAAAANAPAPTSSGSSGAGRVAVTGAGLLSVLAILSSLL